LAVVVFRSFYGSSEPGTTHHDRINPVETVAPPFNFSLASNLPPALYHVILLNDNHHTFDYVIDMLVSKFSFSESEAIEHTMDVHFNGRSIVATSEKDEAEAGRDRIREHGADPRLAQSKGPMNVVIEPAL
jgi:ATP-dependent Clp protease adaptor protein ClpS